MTVSAPISKLLLGLASVLLIVCLLVLATGMFLGEVLGSEYTYFVPRLVYGYFWVKEAGLFEVPWFSPAWCGGLPFYADPRVGFYSVPQLFALFAEPRLALLLTFMMFSMLGALGMYLLGRATGLNTWLSFLAATLFVLNDFYLSRMLHGQLDFHGYTLIPLMAWLIVRSDRASGRGSVFAMLSTGLLLAYLVHSGGVSLLMPAILSVIGLLLIYSLTQTQTVVFRVLAGSVVLGALFSLSKLSAAYAFTSSFSVEAVSPGIFPGIGDAFPNVFTALFLTPWLSASLPHGVDAQEFTIGVTILPLLLMLLGTMVIPTLVANLNASRVLKLVCLALVVMTPVVLVIHSQAMSAVINWVPLLREVTHGTRWLGLLVPIAVVGPLVIFQYFLNELQETSAGGPVMAFIVVLCLGVLASSMVSNTSNVGEGYSAEELTRAWQEVQSGGSVPVVTRVATREGAKTFIGLDNSFARGESSLVCYHELFGSRLERFPVRRLREGSIFATSGTSLNLKNPACYVFPGANDCKVGDHFQAGQQDDLARFSTNQPFEWVKPWWQWMADYLNLAFLLAGGVFWGYKAMRH